MLCTLVVCFAACGNDGPDEGPPEPGQEPVVSYPFPFGKLNYYCFRIPSVVITKSGSVLAFAEGRVNSIADAGDIDIVMRRSTDRGRSWGDLQILRNDGTNRCGNPVPVVLESGRILLLHAWNQGSSGTQYIYMSYSDDDGITWSPHTDITPASISGKSHPIGPCHGIVKQFAPNKGRVIVPCHNLVRSSGADVRQAYTLYSDDDGSTWSVGGPAGNPYGNESTIAELGNGDLMINMRNMNSEVPYRLQAISSDGGLSFHSNITTTLVEQNTGCQGSLLAYSVDSATGVTTLLFSNPNHASSRRHGTIKMSVDNGATWTKSFQYVPSKGENMYSGYSDLMRFDDGTIGVLFEHGTETNGICFKTVRLSDFR